MNREIKGEYYRFIFEKSHDAILLIIPDCVSTFYGYNPIYINEFISDVDTNMYSAKEQKNCVHGVKEFESA